MDKNKKAEKFWNRNASYYDKEEKKDEETYVTFIDKARAYLKPFDTVLDLGCGTGLVSNEIAQNVKSISAVDISFKMLEIARKKAALGNISNVEYIKTTLFDESLKPKSFDSIIAFNVLHLLNDPHKHMIRILELLKPDGYFLSATPCMGERPILNGLFTIGSRFGIMPKITPFKVSDLENLFNTEFFDVIENTSLFKNSLQHMLFAKKLCPPNK